MRPSARAIAPALVIVASAIFFARTHDVGLVGFDAYPILVASQASSIGELLDGLGERLMEPRYDPIRGDVPPSVFYRPLLQLSFAADHALWGLDPMGYQLTNVLLYAACAWAVYALASALVGSSASIAPLMALLVFLLHPLHIEVVPAPARRADLLCALFMTLSLRFQASSRAVTARRPPLFPAIATLLAIAAKESAFVLPILSALVVWLCCREAKPRRALALVLRALAPHAVAVGLMLGARLAVIGEMGGHPITSKHGLVLRVVGASRQLLYELILPQPVMRGAAAGGLLFALAIVTCVTAWWIARGRSLPSAVWDVRRPSIVGVIWVILFALVYGVAGAGLGPWYAVLPLAGWALLTGAAVAGLAGIARAAPPRLRVAAYGTLALLGALLLWQARYSPLIQRYEEWDRATAAADAFLEETRARLQGVTAGEVVRAPPIPIWVAPDTNRPTVRGAAVLTDYSVQAWAERVLPGPPVRVRFAGPMPPRAMADERLLLLTRRMEGF